MAQNDLIQIKLRPEIEVRKSLKIFDDRRYSLHPVENIVVAHVAALGALVLTGSQATEVVVGELGGSAGNHFVVELVGAGRFTGQQPEEVVEEATGVDDSVSVVVGVNDVVVGALVLSLTFEGGSEAHEALAGGVGAVAGAGDAGTGSEVDILEGVLDDEVTIFNEVGVLGLDAG